MSYHRILFFSLIIVLSTSDCFGQAFMQSAGFTIIRGHSKPTARNGEIKTKMGVNGLTYFPRLAVVRSATRSMTIGLPFTIGFRGLANSSGNSVSFGLDLPLVADVNFGHLSTAKNESRLGGYVGGGFGLTHVGLSETSSFGTYSRNESSAGPLFRAGLRFGIPIGRETLNFTLGGFYKLGLGVQQFRLAGGSLMMDF